MGGCLAFIPSAHAQQVVEQKTEATQELEEAANSDGLPDIIVTARRRPESLQETPISVVSLSDEDLEARSVTNLRTIQNFVPNLTFAPSQNVGEAAANVFIRGIGQEDFALGAEAGVAFYVDGVYFARSLGLIMNLTDVDRIEVLRGPQGTLFGKGAIGGAINIVSTMPKPSRERHANAILGNYNRIDLRAVVNEPLSDRLYLRLSAGMVSRDGYFRRLNPPVSLTDLEEVSGKPIDLHREGDDRAQGARLQLRWLITDTLTADMSLDASRKRNNQGANHIDFIDPRFGNFPDINALIREGKLPGPEISNDLAPDDLLESYAGDRNFTHQNLWGVSAVIAKDLGANTLKFIGAYRGLRSHVGTDSDGLYFDIFTNDLELRQRQFSAELQWSGNARRLAYTAGLYAFFEKPRVRIKDIPDIRYTCGCFYLPGSEPLFTREKRQIFSRSYAGYAQGTYGINDRLSATLGLRYTHEAKTLDGQAYLLDANLQPTDILFATGAAKESWNSFTYRAGIELQATSTLMAYGSIARGFKSGGFNTRGDLNLPNLGFTPFGPETAVTYEIGVRSEWLRRKLRINGTLFDTEYDDIQLRQQTIIAGTITTLIENAAKARIKGAEVEIAATPLNGLTLGATFGHLNARYLDVGRVRGLTLHSKLQRTPRNSLSAWVDYETPLRWGTLQLHGDFSYRSKEQFQIFAADNDQPGYGLLGARIGFRPQDESWSVAIFGTNLTDERYRTAGRGTLIQQAGFAYSSIGMPRQLGVELASRF